MSKIRHILTLLASGLLWCGVLLRVVYALELQPEQARYDLVPYLSYFCQENGDELSLAELQQHTFLPVQQANIALAYRQSPCWFRWSMTNQQTYKQQWFVDIPFSLLDDVQLFVLDDLHLLAQYRVGDRVPYHSRQITTQHPTFALTIPAHAVQHYYLRIQTTSPFAVPIRLVNQYAFWQTQQDYQLIIGLFYGISVGLLFYTLAVWALTRERNHLLYASYLASSLIYFTWLHGLLFRYWPMATEWNNQGFYASILFMALTGSFFARYYLQLSARPRLDFIYQLFIVVTLGMMFIMLLCPVWLAARIAPLWTFALIILSFYAGFIRLRDGLLNARLFVWAWSCLLIATVYTVLMNYVGYGNITHAIAAMQSSFALQQILLAIGLAQEMNLLKQENALREQESRVAKAESAAKSEFLARMSHEIRTPMNAVLGITQLLQDSTLSDNQRQHVDLLYSSGKQLLDLINDVLDFSRMDAERLALARESFQLSLLIKESLAVFLPMAEAKNLVLTFDLPDNLPDYVEGDSLRLRQILVNLLGNALKFTHQGKVRLEVNVLYLSATECRLAFLVHDTGIGIAPEQQDKLFDAFSQANSQIAHNYGGSGLGLAICKQLVELMSGSISLTSQLGRGSTFYCELPFIIADGKGTEHLALQQQPTNLVGKRILVAEDSHINQIVIKTMLQRLGCVVIIKNNGQEALEYVMSFHHEVDLILMDYEMPVLNGLHTVEKIRQWEHHVDRHAIPVIALTAHALPHYKRLCLDAGMNEFLSKPILLTQLAETLARFLAPNNNA